MDDYEYMCPIDKQILSVLREQECALGATDVIPLIAEKFEVEYDYRKIARHMMSLAKYSYLKTWLETPTTGGQKRLFELVSA